MFMSFLSWRKRGPLR